VTTGDGMKPPDAAEKSLGEIVGEVSEKASLLVREEIELAKAELQEKISKLAKAVGVAAAAGVFAGFAVALFLHALSWFFVDLYGSSSQAVWLGFLTTVALLLVLGGLAGYFALRWFRGGTPPTPELAIEEAKRTRAELERQKIERDQVKRTLGKGEEIGT
jgi:uncharacterized membrane protein YqjE